MRLDRLDRRLPRLRSIVDAGKEFSASTVVASMQGHVFKLRVRSDASLHSGGGRRGRVVGFSAGSRRRLIEKLARLDVPEQSGALFVSLTYHLDLPDFPTSYSHLRALLERVRRRWSEASGVWRRELQERGAIHFHLIFFGLPEVGKAWFLDAWQEITGDASISQVDVQSLEGWRKVASYVSKYVAKREDCETEEDCGAFGEALDYVTYPHAYKETEGRVWGLFNAEFLPWGVLERYEWADSAWLPRFKRWVRGFQKSVRRHRGRGGGWRVPDGSRSGFFILTEDPSKWLDAALCASLA